MSLVINDIPDAQAYSRLGYRKFAVFPTPAAPIIKQWTSPGSTSAVVFFPAVTHPTTSPWASMGGRCSFFRHIAGVYGTWRYVWRISFSVAQRAVPCWPSPTVLVLILSDACVYANDTSASTIIPP